jgi:hypothetical protein
MEKIISIEPIYAAIVSAKPQIPLTVLKHGPDGIVTQTLFGSEMGKCSLFS